MIKIIRGSVRFGDTVFVRTVHFEDNPKLPDKREDTPHVLIPISLYIQVL